MHIHKATDNSNEVCIALYSRLNDGVAVTFISICDAFNDTTNFCHLKECAEAYLTLKAKALWSYSFLGHFLSPLCKRSQFAN